MKHFASRAFWEAYEKLPTQVRELADTNSALLKQDPQHRALTQPPGRGAVAVPRYRRFRAAGLARRRGGGRRGA
jgi:hypothetical protein